MAEQLIISISGMRGIVGENLTGAIAEEYGCAFGAFLKSKHLKKEKLSVCIGRDSRPSGQMLRAAVTAGLSSVGIDVIDLGMVITPSVGIMVRHLHCSGGVVITASHNPIQYNGIKLLLDNGVAPLGDIAEQIKQYFLKCVHLLRIHRFDPEQVQFDDALVSSAIIWFKNEPPQSNHSVEFTYGGTLAKPSKSVSVFTQELRKIHKWTSILNSNGTTMNKNTSRYKLDNIFHITRGLATGDNKYFIISPETVKNYHIPSTCLIPILPSPRSLQINEIPSDENGYPSIEKQLFLISSKLPEDRIKKNYPNFWEYLHLGIQQGVDKKYLSKHRRPWYSQDLRPPPPLLFTYMGRPGKNKKIFRFLLNRSKATAANAYLLLYPKPFIKILFNKHPQLLRQIWQTLNNISETTLLAEGRVYGGGLYKLEPKELGNIPADIIIKLIDPYLHHSKITRPSSLEDFSSEHGT